MPYVWGELHSGGIRICPECGDVSLEDERHWHPDRKDPMAANKEAMVEVLKRESIDYRELENPSGWMLEVISPVEGGEMARLLTLIDTQPNVQCIIIPNVGLSIQTQGFEEEYSAIAMAEIIGETDQPIEEGEEEGEEAVS